MKFAALFLIFLGLAISTSAQSNAKGFIGLGLADAPGSRGAEVGVVKPGGPADQAGLKPGDIVVAINGAAVDGAATMSRTIAAMAPNQTARLSVIRGSGSSAPHLTIVVVIGSAEGATEPAASSAHPGAASTSTSAPRSSTSSSSAAAAPSAAAHALAVSGYARVTDPIEQAFTVDVPTGWRSEAGLARHSALQVNPYVRSLSPDKMTYLMVGEPSLPTYTPPSRMGNAIGLPEGSPTSSELGGQGMILHYMPGTEFARAYGEQALQGLCRSFKLSFVRERPDLARMGDTLAPTPIPSRSAGGEARFTCTHNKQEMEVRVEAATRTTVDNVMWGVTILFALIAPKDQADKAEEILANIGRSMKFSDAWTQKQNNLSQQAAVAINQRMQEIFRQERTFIQKLNSVDQNFESVDELISGFSTYHDAKTGSDYSLSNANPNKWIDDSTGRVISTATNTKPLFASGYRLLPRASQ
jgi:hypothetical protein